MERAVARVCRQNRVNRPEDPGGDQHLQQRTRFRRNRVKRRGPAPPPPARPRTHHLHRRVPLMPRATASPTGPPPAPNARPRQDRNDVWWVQGARLEPLDLDVIKALHGAAIQLTKGSAGFRPWTSSRSWSPALTRCSTTADERLRRLPAAPCLLTTQQARIAGGNWQSSSRCQLGQFLRSGASSSASC